MFLLGCDQSDPPNPVAVASPDGVNWQPIAWPNQWTTTPWSRLDIGLDTLGYDYRQPIVFGGCSQDGNTYYNDTYLWTPSVYNVGSFPGAWSQVGSLAPSARTDMAMAHSGGWLWMMGGNGTPGGPWHDVWRTFGSSWQCVQANANWSVRSGHMACGNESSRGMADCQLVVMGGCDINNKALQVVWFSKDGSSWTS